VAIWRFIRDVWDLLTGTGSFCDHRWTHDGSFRRKCERCGEIQHMKLRRTRGHWDDWDIE
jgi:hypothetical protein